MDTVWVLGDQLSTAIPSLEDREPGDCRVLVVEAGDKISSKPWHRQHLHLVLASMRRFVGELRDAGFEVDHRRASSMAVGFREHVDAFDPDEVTAMGPMSRPGHRLLERLDVTIVKNNQFVTHYDDFAQWAEGRKALKMEDFYREQRRKTGLLMDGDEPAGDRWNLDAQNREEARKAAERDFADPVTSSLDDLDREVLEDLPSDLPGADPTGIWPTSRRRALARLRHFVDEVLSGFGGPQDAMLQRSWHLNHSLLSPALNLGMLHPLEVCEAVEDAYRAGDVPLNAAEGFIRQVIGWREYVWGIYWHFGEDYLDVNELGADLPLPPGFTDPDATEMACVRDVATNVHERGYAHHIERLMVLANLSTSAGVRPQALLDWMWSSFVDGAEWVMAANVLGMGTYADGGRMSTKPYVSGGAYVDRMSDHCGDCRFDRKARTGDDACPFTTLYWDFLDRHRGSLEGNHRLGRSYANLDRLQDMDQVRTRATDVRDRLAKGTL